MQPIKAGVGMIMCACVSPLEDWELRRGGGRAWLVHHCVPRIALVPYSQEVLSKRLLNGAMALEKFSSLPDILHR